MILASVIISLVLTVGILLLTILTISKGYAYKHTIDPLKEGDKVREYTGDGKRM